jgi:hypothetical protein
MGGETFLVLRDVCQLDTPQGMAEARWATEIILMAGLSDEHQADQSE